MEKKHKTKFLNNFLLCFVLVLALVIPITAYAWSESDYYDTTIDGSDFVTPTDDGWYIFTTTDKAKTSGTFFRTLGFTVSRCVLGEKERDKATQQYVTVVLYEYDDDAHQFEGYVAEEPYYFTRAGVQWVTTTWKISKEYILSEIDKQGFDEWATELETTENTQVYLKFDALITLYVSNNPQGSLWNNLITGDVYGNANKSGLQPVDSLLSRMRSLGFSGASQTSVKSHFNKFIPWNYVNPITPPLDKEPDSNIPADKTENVAHCGKDSPAYVTYNTSTFDLSQGIPTTEDIRNQIEQDGWYGTWDVGKHTTYHEWKFRVKLKWKVLKKTGTNPTTGKNTYSWNDVSKNVTIKVNRPASYFYIQNADLYDYTNGSVENSVYPGNKINYDGNPATVFMNARINGEYNPETVTDWRPNDEEWDSDDSGGHVKWASYSGDLGSADGGKKGKDRAYEKAVEMAENTVGKSGYATARNDFLQIGDTVYMEGDTFTVDQDKSDNGAKGYKKIDASGNYLTETYTKTVTVPSDVANGKYYTDLTANYTRKLPDNGGIRTWTKSGTSQAEINDRIKDAMDTDYKAGLSSLASYTESKKDKNLRENEPVNIHTPVISPVSFVKEPGSTEPLTDEQQKTQLITENTSVNYQLKLDGYYTFNFDPAMHRDIEKYGWSYVLDNDYSSSNSKYNKYTLNKQVRFPFTVKLNDEYFEPDTSTGFTDWIDLGSEAEQISFYIPTWAVENVYGVSGFNERNIEYRVMPLNVVDESGNDHTDETQDTANKDQNKYVATYKIPVQLSGRIYDFTVIGVSDANRFREHDRETYQKWVSLARYKEELRGGTKNRIGGTSVRYTKDGTVTNSWRENRTTPFAMGRSPLEGNGTLIKGNKFSFLVRTMANLSDEKIDRIEITPTFRYYDKDGIEQPADFWFNWSRSDGDGLFVKYGSERDKNHIVPIAFNDGWGRAFQKCYSDDDLYYTIDKHNELYPSAHPLTQAGIYKRKIDSYCFSGITLPSEMRLLTGNLEQLEENLPYEKTDPAFKDLSNVRKQLNDAYVTEKEKDDFRMSMQTWYGEFVAPGDLFVCDKDFDVMDYARDHGLNPYGQDDIWKDRGYVVINFDIKTFNNGEEHLIYQGGATGQWDTEGRVHSVELPKQYLYDPQHSIETKPGDVAVIDLSMSWEDFIDRGIFVIN